MELCKTKFFSNPIHFLPSRIFVGIMLSIIVVLVGIWAVFGVPFYINHSPSAPEGIYVISFDRKLEYTKGDYVIVSCPLDFPDIHISRGSRFLKEVRGFPGDTYEVNPEALVIDGHAYPINHTLSYLPHLEEGSHVVDEGKILLLNTPDYSLDSRYFGPLSQESIQKKVHLLVSYEQIDRWLIDVLPNWALRLLLGKSQVHQIQF